MKTHRFLATIVLGVSFLGSGCGRKIPAEASQAARGEREGGDTVSYREGSGLVLSPQVVTALGLVTADVEERSIAATVQLTAQIYAAAPVVLAHVQVSVGEVDRFETARLTGANLVRIDRSMASATQQVDLLLELAAGTSHRIGDFVSLAGVAEPIRALAVPHSAVLHSAAGTFVYVRNAGAFLRTPVKRGVASRDFVEIADGLLEGDVIVVRPVEQLWLAELRLTKGGGHSH